MSFEITGKLIEKYNTIQVNDRFKKREFVLERTESNGGMEFTDHIKFQLTQDRCDLIENVGLNDPIPTKPSSSAQSKIICPFGNPPKLKDQMNRYVIKTYKAGTKYDKLIYFQFPQFHF